MINELQPTINFFSSFVILNVEKQYVSGKNNEIKINIMAKIRENYERMKDILQLAEIDVAKFTTAGNKSSGTRLRKTMMELKNLAQEIRAEVSLIKNEGKYKTEGK